MRTRADTPAIAGNVDALALLHRTQVRLGDGLAHPDHISVRPEQVLVQARLDEIALRFGGPGVFLRHLLEARPGHAFERLPGALALFRGACTPAEEAHDLRARLVDRELPQARRIRRHAGRRQDRVGGDAGQREAVAFHVHGEVAVLDLLAFEIDRDAAQPMRGLHDLHAPILKPYAAAGLRLRAGVQRHRVEAVAAVHRDQPVRLPDLRRQAKPEEFLRLRQLFGHLARQRRRLRCVADKSPDVSAELLGAISLHRHLVVHARGLGLPGDQHAFPLAVEAQPMQHALQVAVEHAADRELHAPVRAAVVDHVRPALGIAPGRERLAEHLEAHRPVRRQLFRLQHRVPVVSQAQRQACGNSRGELLLHAPKYSIAHRSHRRRQRG